VGCTGTHVAGTESILKPFGTLIAIGGNATEMRLEMLYAGNKTCPVSKMMTKSRRVYNWIIVYVSGLVRESKSIQDAKDVHLP
jgi:hypothetical protein